MTLLSLLCCTMLCFIIYIYICYICNHSQSPFYSIVTALPWIHDECIKLVEKFISFARAKVQYRLYDPLPLSGCKSDLSPSPFLDSQLMFSKVKLLKKKFNPPPSTILGIRKLPKRETHFKS